MIEKANDKRFTKEKALQKYANIYEIIDNLIGKEKRKASNDAWYSIYLKYENKTKIFISQRDYLLCRDLCISTLYIGLTDEQESDVRTFMQEIRKYAAIQELDEAVLNRLISKILVGEVKKVDGQKCQEIKIAHSFCISEASAIYRRSMRLDSR